MGCSELDELNRELKQINAGVTVRQKGNRLYLRGTFPPKPGSSKQKPHQQDLKLGIYSNPAGLKRAKIEALRVGSLLASKTFTSMLQEGSRHHL
ncbi:hypothetical protein JJD41_20660 [Oxynema sp. CENA135]|uniref:hypothetical protein n=1 Tax=Oxynema sp. CENA135 TaxID=984206 RepID=UPI0019098D59|nr:hypothetical protein [Oxynema sp. CENA135]MBK4732259.1 hypothetical protein [Oxynema sp. CENA135]